MSELVSPERARELVEAGAPCGEWDVNTLAWTVRSCGKAVADVFDLDALGLIEAAPDLARTVIAQAEQIARVEAVADSYVGTKHNHPPMAGHSNCAACWVDDIRHALVGDTQATRLEAGYS